MAVLLVGGNGKRSSHKPPDTDPVLTPSAAKAPKQAHAKKSNGHVVQLSGVGSQPQQSSGSGSAADNGPSPGAAAAGRAYGRRSGDRRLALLSRFLPARHRLEG